MPRYDLENSAVIIDKLKTEKDSNFFSNFFNTILSNDSFLIFLLFTLPLFFTIPDFEKWPDVITKLCSSNKYLILEGHDYRKLITFLWTGIAYILFLIPFVQIFQNSLKIKLFLPRLFAATIIGYLPLIVGDEVWKFGMNADFLNILMIVLFCLSFSFIYLWYEVSNIVDDKNAVIQRVWLIYTRGIMYSLVSGIIILDLICETFYQNMSIRNYNNVFPGVFGVIDPKILLLFFPLSLLIGIFVQIIWEDKPITHPI